VSGLRIGVLHLPAKDSAYIRALVRLFSYSDKLDWHFVAQAPYDVLVTDAAARTAHGAALGRCGGTLLTLVPTRTALSTNELDYPIRADQLRDWLKKQQPAAPVSAAGAPDGVAPARFKLRRWPSVQQLRGDALRIRMATLMSKHPLSVDELAHLIDLPLSVCVEFIDGLHSANLLVASAASAPRAPAAANQPGAAAAGSTAMPAAPPKTGLLASIRRRFGL